MGIGQLYRSVLKELGHTVVTVDSNPKVEADYVDYVAAFMDHEHFDTVHICTPNFTHVNVARHAGRMNAGIVFVEKPGVHDHLGWQAMVDEYPDTRFMMVKNNQYRDEIKQFKELAAQSEVVHITWNNRNRIPSPGSWFTTKDLAFGGVSRDLIPHMLSYYCTLTDYTKGTKTSSLAEQRWQLKDIDSTEYGFINANGVYDVDDHAKLEFVNGDTKWVLEANWRTLEMTEISIRFGMKSSAVRHELGLCPAEAYKKMIAGAIENLNNNDYWQQQLAQDIWIHQQIEVL